MSSKRKGKIPEVNVKKEWDSAPKARIDYDTDEIIRYFHDNYIREGLVSASSSLSDLSDTESTKEYRILRRSGRCVDSVNTSSNYRPIVINDSLNENGATSKPEDEFVKEFLQPASNSNKQSSTKDFKAPVTTVAASDETKGKKKKKKQKQKKVVLTNESSKVDDNKVSGDSEESADKKTEVVDDNDGKQSEARSSSNKQQNSFFETNVSIKNTFSETTEKRVNVDSWSNIVLPVSSHVDTFDCSDDWKVASCKKNPSSCSNGAIVVNASEFPQSKTWDVCLACCQCSQLANGKYFEYNISFSSNRHSCRRNVLFVKSKTDQKYWNMVRKRDSTHQFTGNYAMCNKYPLTVCVMQDNCSFAHSLIERELWNLDKSNKFSIEKFISKHSFDTDEPVATKQSYLDNLNSIFSPSKSPSKQYVVQDNVVESENVSLVRQEDKVVAFDYYDFKLCCANCKQKYLQFDFDDRPYISACQFCSQSTLLAKAKNAPFDIWMVIRPPSVQALGYDPIYELCPNVHIYGSCIYADSCHNPHNDGEKCIWNWVAKKQLDYENLKSLIFTKQNSSSSSINQDSFMQKSDFHGTNIFTNCSSYQYVPPSNVLSNCLPFAGNLNLNGAPTFPLKFPLDDTHQYRLGCSFCLKPMPYSSSGASYFYYLNSDSRDSHTCNLDRLFICTKVGRSDGWKLIRPKPESILETVVSLCSYYSRKRPCPEADACFLPHSLEEQNLWNLEVEHKFNVLEFINKCRWEVRPNLPAIDTVQHKTETPSSFSPFNNEHLSLWGGTISVRPLSPPPPPPQSPPADPFTSGFQKRSNLNSLDDFSDGTQLNSFKQVAVNQQQTNDSFPLHKTHEISVACFSCMKQSEANNMLLFSKSVLFGHSCKRDTVFVRRSQTQLWTYIRPMPAIDVLFKEFAMCNFVSKSGSCRASCNFAHSEEERLLWNAERFESWKPPLQNVISSKTASGSTSQSQAGRIRAVCFRCKSPRNSTGDKCTQGHVWINPLISFVSNNAPARSIPKPTGNFKFPKMYVMCDRPKPCSFGNKCLFPHSEDELILWNQMLNSNELDLTKFFEKNCRI